MKPGILALILSLALGLAFQTFQNIDRPFLGERLPRHQAIIQGQAELPYRYRLLVPWITEAPFRILAPRIGAERAFLSSYFLFDILGYAVSLLAMMMLLGALGHSTSECLAGTVLLAALIPLTLRTQWYQPWSIIEPGLLACGLAALVRRRTTLLIVLSALAALNRETGIYIGVAALAAYPRARSSWIAAGIGLAVLGLARLALGTGPREVSAAAAWARNVQPENLRAALLGAAMLFGPLPWVAARALPHSAKVLQRASILVPLHLALVAVFGIWIEGRLLLPLLAILIPLAFGGWFPHARSGLPSPGDRQ